jgi:hypothetical protein
MSWNYRILAHEEKGEVYFKMHEVYYNENNIPNGYTENVVSIEGEDISGIEFILSKAPEALLKPILYAGSKFPKEYKPK